MLLLTPMEFLQTDSDAIDGFENHWDMDYIH